MSVNIDKALRTYINKNTVHISRQRGKGTIKVPTEAFLNVQKSLIKSINSFIGELDNNIKNDYKDLYNAKEVKNVKSSVLINIMRIIIYNVQHGEHIDL